MIYTNPFPTTDLRFYSEFLHILPLATRRMREAHGLALYYGDTIRVSVSPLTTMNYFFVVFPSLAGQHKVLCV